MKNSECLDIKIDNLKIESIILEKLKENNIITVRDLWSLKRCDLKEINLNDNQINNIIIKLQLFGIDLNKKIYPKN